MSARAVPLDRLMGRLAAELGALEAAGGRVEAAVGELVARAGGPAPAGLQELDLLVQTVRDLAACAAALSGTVPPCRIDAGPGLAALRLARVRAALAGEAPAPAGGADDVLF